MRHPGPHRPYRKGLNRRGMSVPMCTIGDRRLDEQAAKVIREMLSACLGSPFGHDHSMDDTVIMRRDVERKRVGTFSI